MIGPRERLQFAAGDIFAGGGASLIAVLYLIFLTDVVGLQPALAGTAILVAKLWDAINDPLMGSISDRTRTRLGRRRPFLLVGSLLLIGVMALLWLPTPPVSGQVALMIWAMGSYIVYNTVQTTIAVPYISMSSEVTTDPGQRNALNLTRLLFSTVASASITLLASHLVELYREDVIGAGTLYRVVVLGFGGLFTLVVLGVVVGCRERVPLPADATRPAELSWRRRALAPLRTPAMRTLLGMYLCQAIAMDVIAAMVLYYSDHVVAGVSSTVFLGLFIGVNVIAYPIMLVSVRHVSKHLIYRAGLPVAIVAVIAIGLYPRTGPVVGVYALAFALAVGMAGAQLICWVIFPDVLDAAELHSGRRDAGAYSGFMTFTRGIGTAITLQLIGLVLQFSGYTPGGGVQPDSAVWGIRLVIGVGIGVLLSIGFVVASKHSLTRSVCAANSAELDRRRTRPEA